MNPAIHSRWGLLCPSCQTALMQPNRPWPQPCATCGTRTHVGCLGDVIHWLVDLDDTLPPYEQVKACNRCRSHAANNFRLINQISQSSGSEPLDVYRAFKAKQPPSPKKTVQSLWGDYRVDPENFVPAVTKVLDIVHSAGPKVRWAVELMDWSQVPMTNLSSKEIKLPNYFDSPHALGRTHEEILDAMTGAAMHEAGHAAYDSAQTIIDSQRRLAHRPGENTWASATCLNVVCDYNLERKVIERYPAFRHYFTECHRWSVRDSLPNIVKALAEDDAEDKLSVRIAVLVWEMLGPGDLSNAGATLSPKLKWITAKCFDILKYAYTKGLLNTEQGKLKTARALYELIKIVNPVGAPPNLVPVPQPTTPPGTQTIGGTPGSGGQPGQPGPNNDQDDAQSPEPGKMNPDDFWSEDDDWDPDKANDELDRLQAEQDAEDAETDDDSDRPGGSESESDRDQDDGGPDRRETGGGTGSEPPSDPESEQETEGTPGSPDEGTGQTNVSGTGSDLDGDDDTDGSGSPDTGTDADQDSDVKGEEAQGQDDHDDVPEDDGQPGQADNTSPESDDPGGSVSSGPSHKGGQSGTEKPVDPDTDPFTGKGNMEDDPTRRKNSRKDALDDLEEQNSGQAKIDGQNETPLTDLDESMNAGHRNVAEAASKTTPVKEAVMPPNTASYYRSTHEARVKELSPVISRLKKILRFRNADWGGMQTGRRSGNLTRRHVARLSALGSDKVFHKTKPDQTPKVRIALLIDESESMRTSQYGVPRYLAATNAATALTQALHGIRGVKLWCWGYSMQRDYGTGRAQTLPTIRQYVDPAQKHDSAILEVSPMFGGTPTGEAMDRAAEVIDKGSTPDEKKVIFIITDGEAGGNVSTGSIVRKWTGKVTFVHIGLGTTKDTAIPFYVGPVNDITLLPDLLSESVSEILT